MTVKGITRIVSCAVVALMAFTGCKDNGKTDDVQRKDIDTIPMMVQQIKECSRLYTAEYKVHKIVTHSDTTKISGKILGKEMSLSMPGGRRKVAIPIDATLKAYIDFADFSEDNVTRDGDMIRITLPNPHVVMTSSRIDHEGIKKYVSLIRRDFSDEELSHYEKQGRADIIADIPKLGILGSARRSAATQLLPIISMLGIKHNQTLSCCSTPSAMTWIMD